MFQEKIFKNLQKKRLWEYFPPILKKRKKKVTYLLFKASFIASHNNEYLLFKASFIASHNNEYLLGLQK